MAKRKMDAPAHRPTARALQTARQESGREVRRTAKQLARERLRRAVIAHLQLTADAVHGGTEAAALAEIAAQEVERAREQLETLDAQEQR